MIIGPPEMPLQRACFGGIFASAGRHTGVRPLIECTGGGLVMDKTKAEKTPLPQDLILEDRSRLTVTGVQRVVHCNAENAALETGRGTLNLSGAQISIAKLDLEAGEVKLTGRFDGLEYSRSAASGGFWQRLLR